MISINDFVIKEDICNMQCDYCLTNISLFKKISIKNDKLKTTIYANGTLLKHNMDNITELLYETFHPAILKISGGEVLLIKGICDYIKRFSTKYKKIQVLTNGLLLKKHIVEELKQYPNLCLQLSLDHHTIHGNFYRTKTTKMLNTILENLDYALSQKMSVEINCVLNNKNAHIIESFAEYLLQYKNNVVLLPFPVRGKNREFFKPKYEQLEGVQTLLNKYDRFENILPPKTYLEYLYRFLQKEKRELQCLLPSIALGSFDDGNITPCPNYWFSSFGNILTPDASEVLHKVNNDKIYNVICNKKCLLRECSGCFTPWEILNLYKHKKIKINELKKLPLFSFKGVENYF